MDTLCTYVLSRNQLLLYCATDQLHSVCNSTVVYCKQLEWHQCCMIEGYRRRLCSHHWMVWWCSPLPCPYCASYRSDRITVKERERLEAEEENMEAARKKQEEERKKESQKVCYTHIGAWDAVMQCQCQTNHLLSSVLCSWCHKLWLKRCRRNKEVGMCWADASMYIQPSFCLWLFGV